MLPVVLLSLLPALVTCSGEGNIRLLEDDVATAMKACVQPADGKDGAPGNIKFKNGAISRISRQQVGRTYNLK